MTRPADGTGTATHDPAPSPEPSGRQSRARPEQERTAARSSFRRTRHHSGITDTSNFRIGPIKSFVSGIYDGLHATPRESDSGPVFLGIKNVTPQGRLDLSAVRHIAETDYKKWTTRVVPQEDDIVFSYEATLHRYAIVPADFKCCLGRRMALIRPDRTKALPRFLHYYFLTPAWRAVMESHIVSGATVDRIPLAKFPDFEVCLPDLSVQHRMASVLAAYDDLIENNRRRIRLLEQAARMLYEEWFVRLRFPGHEGMTITNGVPDGWETKPLIELASMTMGQSPKSTHYNEEGRGLPFHQGVTNFGQRFPSHRTWCTVTNRIALPGDILFSVRAPVGRINVTLDRIVIGRGIAAIRSNRGQQNFLFYALKNRFFKDDLIGGGTIFSAVAKKDLHRVELVQPEDGIVSLFTEFVAPIDRQIASLHEAVGKLCLARDAVLPRLMNGEIECP